METDLNRLLGFLSSLNISQQFKFIVEARKEFKILKTSYAMNLYKGPFTYDVRFLGRQVKLNLILLNKLM